MRIPHVFAAMSVAIAATACKTDSAGSVAKSVDFATDAGTLVFFVDDDGGQPTVLRYLCKDDGLDRSTFAAVRQACELKQPGRFPGQNGVEKSAFETAVASAFVASANDGKSDDGSGLNAFEKRLLAQMMACLATPEPCDTLKDVPRRNQTVAGHFQANLVGMFSVVFDGDNASQGPAATPAPTPADDGSASLKLADDSGPTSLATVAFKIPIFVQQVQVVFQVPASAPAIRSVGFQFSGGCGAKLAGLSSATLADGGALIGPTHLIPTTGQRFILQKGNFAGGTPPPLKITQVSAVMRRNAIGPINCTVTLNGDTGGDQPPPPPPPDNGFLQAGDACAIAPTAKKCAPGLVCKSAPGVFGGGHCAQSGPNPPPVTCTAAQRDSLMARFTSTPGMRHWHFLWHGIRNGWDQMSPEEQQQIVQNLGERWGRHPVDDDNGEEFFHMHMNMIAMVQRYLKANGCGFYQPWTQPPQPNDVQFRTYTANIPSGGIQQLMQWHAQATNQQSLAGMSLGRFGTWLEGTLHNNWHMRHANPALASNSFDNLDLLALPADPGHELNVTSQNWLGHPYSSHVNPYFWSLHGYVNDRLYGWLAANGYQGLDGGPTVSDHTKTCTSGCYTWKRIWDGIQPASPVGTAQPMAAAAFGASPGDGDHADHGTSEAEDQGFAALSTALKRLIATNANMFPEEFDITDSAP